jgi:hypothetical protein
MRISQGEGQMHPSNEQLAEVAHPAVVERLSKDMLATAAVLDATNARSFAADDPWKALATLRESVNALSDEAELHRPDLPPGR